MKKNMTRIKIVKRIIDTKMKCSGDIDEKTGTIKINPRKGNVLNTVIHENLHSSHWEKPEKWIYKKAKEMEKKTSIKKAIKLLKPYVGR